jgi:hypothetical protein
MSLAINLSLERTRLRVSLSFAIFGAATHVL